MAYKLHCDLCDRDMSKDENYTKVTWEDNEGVEYECNCFFRKQRRFKATICDECLGILKKKGWANDTSTSN